MPFSKEKNRRIYITALVISFLLIVGSIYLHLRQKTHLGRMSFNLDRERVKPTAGVVISTEKIAEYDSSYENYGHDEAGFWDSIPTQKEDEDITNNDNKEYVDDNLDEDTKENADSDDENADSDTKSFPNDSNTCLRCLCMTVNECRPTFCGSGNPCGLYRISKNYWIDSGKPTIAGGSIDNEDQDYLTCVNDDTCSATVIHNYYNRFKRDCNKDGIFDCKDQIALHMLGPTGCLTQNLSHIHANRMKNCFIESNLNYGYSLEDYDDY